MARLLFYVAVIVGGCVLVVAGSVAHRWPESVVGLVIAGGAWLMLATGWWWRWEQTVDWPRRNGDGS